MNETMESTAPVKAATAAKGIPMPTGNQVVVKRDHSRGRWETKDADGNVGFGDLVFLRDVTFHVADERDSHGCGGHVGRAIGKLMKTPAGVAVPLNKLTRADFDGYRGWKAADGKPLKSAQYAVLLPDSRSVVVLN